MKDQYVGDINDFLKYSLLRSLGTENLGVVWMHTDGDQRSDGLRLGYLREAHRYRAIDPTAFDGLADLVATGRRSVQAVMDGRVLEGAAFATGILQDGAAARTSYFVRAWEAIGERPVVFFDPDNGLAVKSVRRGSRNSAKYLYWCELADAFDRGHSMVVYQHFPRRPRVEFLEALAVQIRDVLPVATIGSLVTPHVAFVAIPQQAHAEWMLSAIREFAARATPYASAVTLPPRV